MVVNTANVGQTVPSLAILGMVIPVLGIGLKPAVFALPPVLPPVKPQGGNHLPEFVGLVLLQIAKLVGKPRS